MEDNLVDAGSFGCKELEHGHQFLVAAVGAAAPPAGVDHRLPLLTRPLGFGYRGSVAGDSGPEDEGDLVITVETATAGRGFEGENVRDRGWVELGCRLFYFTQGSPGEAVSVEGAGAGRRGRGVDDAPTREAPTRIRVGSPPSVTMVDAPLAMKAMRTLARSGCSRTCISSWARSGPAYTENKLTLERCDCVRPVSPSTDPFVQFD